MDNSLEVAKSSEKFQNTHYDIAFLLLNLLFQGMMNTSKNFTIRDLKLPLCPCLINASFLSVLFLHSLKIDLLNNYNVSRNLEMSQKKNPQHENNSLEGLKD